MTPSSFPVTSVLAGVALLASASLALVEPAHAAPPTPKGGTATVAGQAAEPSPVRGVIKAVSDTRLVLDPSAPGSGPDTLALDGHTVFQQLGKTLTAKDLKVGAPVTVTYVLKDGKPVATRVWVRFARTAPAAASPAKGR
jgi:hypothetical protein